MEDVAIPFEEIDATQLLSKAPCLRIMPIQSGYDDFFTDSDVEKIRLFKLDIALRFGFRLLKGDSLSIARFEVWSYHHDDNTVYRGSPPGFGEMYHGDPVTGCVLQIITSELDGGTVLYRSWARTQFSSWRKNAAGYHFRSSAFFMRKLRELQSFGPECLQDDSLDDTYLPYQFHIFKAPGNAQMVRFIVNTALRPIKSVLKKSPNNNAFFVVRSPGHEPPRSFHTAKKLKFQART